MSAGESTDPIALAAAAHRHRMKVLADGAPEVDWDLRDDDPAPIVDSVLRRIDG